MRSRRRPPPQTFSWASPARHLGQSRRVSLELRVRFDTLHRRKTRATRNGTRTRTAMRKAWAVIALTLGLFAGPAAAEPQTVTVRLVRSTAQAAYYIAVAKGYFAQEGIALDSGDTRSALDTIGPLATGQLDVSMGAATAGFFNAARQGFDLRVVAAMGIQGPVMSTQPLVRKALWDDGTIRSGKDLRGRKVAINAPGDITEFFLTLIARKYGMSVKDID